jgi:hypothetical protein
LQAIGRCEHVNHVATTEARVAALKAEAERVTEGVREQSRRSTNASTIDLAAQVEAETMSNEAFADSLATAAAQEAVDSSWSTATAAEVSRSMLDAALAKSRVDEIRCYTTLCRIDASHGTRLAEDMFITQLVQLDAFRDSEGFIERQERADGSVSNVVYISRAGHQLPGKK